MKKRAMNITFKKVLFSPVWLFRFLNLKIKHRKFKKNPDGISAVERYKYILKLSKKILKMYNVDLEIKGFDNLPSNGGVLVVANHKSLFDPLIMLIAMEKQSYEYNAKELIPTFVAKQELKDQKFINSAMHLLNTFFVDRNSVKQSFLELNKFAEYVKFNKTYGVIFPEGTRVKDQVIGEFKSAPFKIAQKEYLTIQPVVIKNSLEADNAKRKGRLTVTVEFLTPIKPNTFITQESSKVAQYVQNIVKTGVESNEN
ncbi:lysophospholipid acyltransferase family protein [Mycoplasma seminis]|uniref:Lysophospholipid acyltransferase family protein n=1 Tax=Mycoplasma seminis TaxID=512749 RepID=A0ABY9HAW6_9MOLU|nr:lysophospholipid acyltransferase family protein [Mycoplasma seminis]WLP85749.1 lysophospholipid acyltransferase family protein [Mycoplasma seminis]